MLPLPNLPRACLVWTDHVAQAQAKVEVGGTGGPPACGAATQGSLRMNALALGATAAAAAAVVIQSVGHPGLGSTFNFDLQ